MIDVPALVPAIAAWLPRQRWYEGQVQPRSLQIVDQEIRGDRFPVLIRLLVDADGEVYQVVVGVRSREEYPEFLRGHDQAFLADVSTHQGDGIAYDAVYDADLDLVILDWVAPHEKAQRARVMAAEQSNSSIVYDERIILKLFRHVQAGHNPEVEVIQALTAQGFRRVAEALATKRIGDYDVAILQPFLAGAVEGWALALTSLRDLFGMQDTASIPVISLDAPPPPPDPGQAGGDFSGEAARLGAMTGGMHVAMADAFGRQPADPGLWAASIARQLEALGPGDVEREGAQAIVDRLASLDGGAGTAIRVHGDYHLGQVLRTDAGWFVLDFEGEPARSLEERRRPTSPLKDVSGMLRSFHYASAVARTERDDALEELATAWEDRNRKAFLRGYLGAAGPGGILPSDPEAVATVLAAFELEKAVYELGYERAFRPEWEAIPLSALRRLTAPAATHVKGAP